MSDHTTLPDAKQAPPTQTHHWLVRSCLWGQHTAMPVPIQTPRVPLVTIKRASCFSPLKLPIRPLWMVIVLCYGDCNCVLLTS